MVAESRGVDPHPDPYAVLLMTKFVEVDMRRPDRAASIRSRSSEVVVVERL